jgi:hypothetical protein
MTPEVQKAKAVRLRGRAAALKSAQLRWPQRAAAMTPAIESLEAEAQKLESSYSRRNYMEECPFCHAPPGEACWDDPHPPGWFTNSTRQ